MSKNDFVTIKRYLHLADNQMLDKTNKMAKVQPLVDLLNDKLMQFGVFSKHLSVDEQMVPYFGHHSCKMTIRNKPIRFGFKKWILAGDGYPFNMEIYTGKAKSSEADNPLCRLVLQH